MRTESWRAALIGIAVAAAVTLPGLGIGTLWDNSETAYGEVAREVVLYGDPVVLHLNGHPWFVQPPLYFWLAAFFIKLFGLVPFAVRLPSALATIALGAASGYAAARVAGARAGVFVAVILSTSLMEAVIGRLAIMDALLDGAVAASIFLWFRALELGSDRSLIFGWIAAAFGVLAKGPVAIVMALMVVVPWALWDRYSGVQLVRPSLRSWVVAAIAFLAIVLPWPIALASRAGMDAVTTLIGHYTVGRYLGTIENQTGPWFYYLPVVILGFFPWVAFLPAAFMSSLRLIARGSGDLRVDSLHRLAIVWTIVPFVFFSLAQTKLPNYIALELPALALLVALWFDHIAEEGVRRSALISAAVVPITIGCVAFAISRFSEIMHLNEQTKFVIPDLTFLGLIIFAGSVLTFIVLLRPQSAGRAPFMLGATSVLTVLVIAFVAEPHAEPLKPIPQFARTIELERRPDDGVAIQGVSGGNALLFYTGPVVASIQPVGEEASSEASDARAVICGSSRVFVVTKRERPAHDPTYGRRRTLLAQSGSEALYLFDGPRCDRGV